MADIPDDAILSRDMGSEFGPYALANWGPVVWYVHTTLVRVDLRDGTSTTVAAPGKGGGVYGFATNGNVLVWFQSSRSGSGIHWQLRSQDLSTGEIRTIDEGRWAGRAIQKVAIDGDLVAYSLGATQPGNRNASQIIVRRLSTGQVVRRIYSDLAVYDMAMSDGNVLFSAGKFSWNPYDQVHGTELFLSTEEDPEPCFVVDTAYEVAVLGDQLAWDAGRDGDLIRATVSDVERGGGCRPPETPTITWASQLSAGEGLFAWSGYGLEVWDPATDGIRTIADSFGPIENSIGGGWIAWASYVEQDGREIWPLNAAPLDAVRLAMGV